MNIKVYENAINNNKILLFKNQKYNKFCIYEEEILKKLKRKKF